MKRFIKSRANSFKFAFEGLFYVIKSQKNAWIHLAITLFVLVLGIWLELKAIEWVAMAVAIGLVWICELFNTAFETLIDLVQPDQHPHAKLSKDIAAGAVLISACVAVIVGLLIFGPLLLRKLVV